MNLNEAMLNPELTASQVRAAIAATREHRLALEAELAALNGTDAFRKANAASLHEEIRALQAHEEQLEEQLFLTNSQTIPEA